jgi:hypothetical protein
MDRTVRPFKVEGSTITYADGHSRTFVADIVRAVQIDPIRIVVLTAKPPSRNRTEPNLHCLDGNGRRYWKSPDDMWSRGHYVEMETLPDRLSLLTDEAWRVELLLPYGNLLNEWPDRSGPRYTVEGTRLHFTKGGVAELGSRVLATLDAGPVVVVRTERGIAESPAENVVAVNDLGTLVWRVPKHRWANDTGPVQYSSIAMTQGELVLLNPAHFAITLDPQIGAILKEKATY